MKICILVSSYVGTGSSFECCNSYQNPAIYVNSHDFVQIFITKENAKAEIDRVLAEGFDYIWHFLWGPAHENVAGVDEIKYLESKNVPMIGTSSKFLSLTKLDYKRALLSANIQTPKGISINGDDASIAGLQLGDLKFPLIVKPSVGCGIEHVTQQSACHDVSALEKQIRLLKSKIHVKYEIMIEEFVEGDEIAVMVLETNDGVIALQPLIYVFPNDWPSTKKFLDFDAKFFGVERGEVKYKVFDGNPEMKEKIQEAAVKAYQELGVLGSGYARVDFRIKGSDVYALEINPCPAFFYERGNARGDDFVIESTFPGGHERLVETIISSKIRFGTAVKEYNATANMYETILINEGKSLVEVWKTLVDTFDYGGAVLDLGCGTGMVGKAIKQKYDARLIGVDVSAEMVKFIDNYDEIHVGLMENVVVELKSSFNHIVSSGALEWLDEKSFRKLLSRMFRLATKSISLVIDEISDEYKSECATKYNASLFNHVDLIQNFPIPPEWSLVYKQRTHVWQSPRIGSNIYGLVLRYERKSSCAIV